MNKLKKYLFVCLLLACLVPAIQKQYPFINSAPLNGWFKALEMPKFDWNSWFSGKFQAAFDKSLETNIGLRSSFVRVNNQLNFSLFNFATGKNVIVGKEGYLFEEGYITGYMGVHPVDSNAVKLKIAKAEFVHRELEKKGKHLLIILAPGKASFYPEHIPSQYFPENKKVSHYDLYSKYLKSSQLHYIDFNGYFKKIKGKTPYPLYPKQGTHWSVYGATLAMDSLLKYIKYNFKYNLPQIRITEIELPDTCRGSDYDMGAVMNLMFPMKHDKLAYPKIEFENDGSLFRPSVISMGDSYFWTFFGMGLNTKAFKEHEFWYYNELNYIDGVGETPVVKANTASAILKKDLVIIMQTEAFYHVFGKDFIECAYEQFKNKQ